MAVRAQTPQWPSPKEMLANATPPTLLHAHGAGPPPPLLLRAGTRDSSRSLFFAAAAASSSSSSCHSPGGRGGVPLFFRSLPCFPFESLPRLRATQHRPPPPCSSTSAEQSEERGYEGTATSTLYKYSVNIPFGNRHVSSPLPPSRLALLFFFPLVLFSSCFRPLFPA